MKLLDEFCVCARAIESESFGLGFMPLMSGPVRVLVSYGRRYKDG
jgi:hypothetical protein